MTGAPRILVADDHPALLAAVCAFLEESGFDVAGRIEAVGRSFYLRGDATEHFALMVPESTLHEGRNSIELFEVAAGRLLRL